MTLRKPLPLLCLAALLPLLARPVAAAEPTFHGKTLAEWSRQLREGKPLERRRAATALGLGPFGKSAVPALVDALGTSDEDVRRCAIHALGDIGPEAATALPALTKLLQRNDVRRDTILHALGRMGPSAIPLLLDVVRKNPPRYGYAACHEAIASVGKEAVPHLEKLLQHEDATTRAQAAHTLCHFRKRDVAEAVPALLRALEDPDVQVRRWAAEALEKLAAEENTRPAALIVLPTLSKPALPILRPLLGDNSPEVRLAVVDRLGRASLDTLPLLLMALDDPDRKVRRRATEGLDRDVHDLEEALPRLVKALDDPDEDVRFAIIRAIGLSAHGPKCMRVLTRALADGNEETRTRAEMLLSRPSFSSQAAPHLLPMLRDPRDLIRIRAIRMIAQGGEFSEPVVHALCEALRDPEALVRLNAARALGKLSQGDRAARRVRDDTLVDIVAPALRARLRDADERVRVAAAVALCSTGQVTDAAVRLLMRSLVSVEETWDREVLEAIGRRGLVVLPELVAALDDPDPRKRQFAADFLGSIGPQANAAVPALVRCTASTDSKLAGSAIVALGRMGKDATAAYLRAFEQADDDCKASVCWKLRKDDAVARAVVPALVGMLDHEGWHVRFAALDTLGRIEARGKDVARAVARRLEDDRARIRQDACGFLGQLGVEARSFVPSLEQCLVDEEPWIRSTAAVSLGKVDPSGKVVAPMLAEAMRDRDGTVRWFVVDTLASLRAAAKPALPQFQQALRDPEVRVRVRAARAVGEITGDRQESLVALKGFLAREDGEDRAWVLGELWRLSEDRSHLVALVRLLESDDETARRAASEHLLVIGPPARGQLPAIEVLKKHPRCPFHKFAASGFGDRL